MISILSKLLNLFPSRFVEGSTFFVLYRIVKYRKEVVQNNIDNVFKNLSLEEKQLLGKNYYKVLSRYIAELVVFNNSREKELLSSYLFKNTSILNGLANKHNNTILLASHFGNWEVIISLLPIVVKCKVIGVYKPLSNKSVEKEILAFRSKFGLELVPMEKVVRYFNRDENYIFVFINDQSPPMGGKGSWVEFLGVDTLWYDGILRLQKKFNTGFVYQKVKPTQTGYEVSFIEMDNNRPLEGYVRLLEKDVSMKPEFWLWSHKRWKNNKGNSF